MKQALKEPTSESRPDAAELAPGIARLNLWVQAPTPEALQLVSENLARKYNVVPLAVEDTTLRVAMSSPDDILTIEALAALTKKRISPVAASVVDIREAVDFNYKAFGEVAEQFGS